MGGLYGGAAGQRAMKLDALRGGEVFDGQDALHILRHRPQAQCRPRRHGDVILLIGRGGQAVHAARGRHRAVLRDQGRGRDLSDHEARIQPARLHQKRRQAGEGGVGQQGDPPFGDGADFGQGQGQNVGGEGHGFGMEIAAREKLAALHQQGVVRHRIGLALQCGTRLVDEVEAGAHHLGLAAQAIGVLHADIALAVAFADCAAGREFAQRGGDADLARLAAQRMDARIEGRVRAACRIDTHRPREQAGAQQIPRAELRIEGDGGGDLRAVEQRQPLLRTQHQRRAADGGQGFGAVMRQSLRIGGRALADQHQREMRERCEIARGTDRALRRHIGQHVGGQKGQQRFDDLGPRTGGAARQRHRLQRQGEAHHRARQVLAGSRRMAAQQVELQLRQLAFGDARGGELAKAGVHAVQRGPCCQGGAQGGEARRHIGPPAFGEGEGGTIANGAQIGQPCVAGGKGDRVHGNRIPGSRARCHTRSCARRTRPRWSMHPPR